MADPMAPTEEVALLVRARQAEEGGYMGPGATEAFLATPSMASVETMGPVGPERDEPSRPWRYERQPHKTKGKKHWSVKLK